MDLPVGKRRLWPIIGIVGGGTLLLALAYALLPLVLFDEMYLPLADQATPRCAS